MALDTNSIGLVIAVVADALAKSVVETVGRASLLDAFISFSDIPSVANASIADKLAVGRADRVGVDYTLVEGITSVSVNANAGFAVVDFVLAGALSCGLVAVEH